MEDFQDLLELLRAHPEWRQKLWELLAAEELLRLPAELEAFRKETERWFQRVEVQIAALVEAQRRTEERVERLAEAQRRHYEEFITFRAEVERRFASLAEALEILTGQMARVEERLGEHARDLGDLKTMRLEALYREEASSFFRTLLRRASAISGEQKNRILDEAVEAGRITEEEEADQAAPLDLLVQGFHRQEDRPLYLAVEISWLGGTEDVKRAWEQAPIFARALGAEVWPVVAAKELTDPVRKAAQDLRVWWVQDRQAFPPEKIPNG